MAAGLGINSMRPRVRPSPGGAGRRGSVCAMVELSGVRVDAYPGGLRVTTAGPTRARPVPAPHPAHQVAVAASAPATAMRRAPAPATAVQLFCLGYCQPPCNEWPFYCHGACNVTGGIRRAVASDLAGALADAVRAGGDHVPREPRVVVEREAPRCVVCGCHGSRVLLGPDRRARRRDPVAVLRYRRNSASSLDRVGASAPESLARRFRPSRGPLDDKIVTTKSSSIS